MAFALSFVGARQRIPGLIYEDVHDRASLVLSTMASTVTPLAREERWGDVQRLLENVASSRLIKGIRILGVPGGVVIASSDPLEVGGRLVSALVVRLEERRSFIEESPPSAILSGYEAAVPLVGGVFDASRSSGVAAAIVYTADMKAELARMASTTESLVYQAVFGIGLTLVSSLLLMRLLVAAPLGRIADAAERAASGRYDARLSPAERGEFRIVVHAFNRLMDEIQAKTAELESANAGLETKVAERTRSLEEANAELAEARDRLVTQEKSALAGRFAAGIAHEINTPLGYVKSGLATLGGYLESLGANGSAGASKEAAWMIEDGRSIVAEAEEGLSRIAVIVLALRELIEPSVPERGIHAAAEVVDAALAGFGPLPKALTISVESTGTQLVEVSLAETAKALSNVIRNAVDASSPGGRIVIECAGTGDGARISVLDGGPGIPALDIERVFDPFFTTKEPGKGVGLGLCLARSAIERQGGRIHAGNREAGGASFVIFLPGAAAEPAPEERAR
ncbi:MAG: HAMP domain-containing histidine kinase [Spirochaetaceae bacterium]|nr:HAMP domain-containing histidine kinase [Spirochaetaceae bacterium]